MKRTLSAVHSALAVLGIIGLLIGVMLFVNDRPTKADAPAAPVQKWEVIAVHADSTPPYADVVGSFPTAEAASARCNALTSVDTNLVCQPVVEP